jgi:hypothetical protein
MNIVAIDPSLSCTALVVNDKKYIYAKEELGISPKTSVMKKWFDVCDQLVEYRWIDAVSSVVHTESEVLKILRYDEITSIIVKDILCNINQSKQTIVGIEGYSYSSAVGPLIDLVTVSTLLRSKILNNITSNLRIFQPAELKLLAAKLTYAPIISGVKVKKETYRNNEGVAGGSFKKHEIYKALIENTTLDGDWIDMLKDKKNEIFEMSSVPKPLEDMNDAKILYEILNKQINI